MSVCQKVLRTKTYNMFFVHFFCFVYMANDIKVVPSTLDNVGLLMVGTTVS